jgi:uncharacterized membrane protein YeaQ/YmgE (transglycosylase-associated protein family)
LRGDDSQGAFMDMLYFLIIGLVAGWLAGVLVRGGGFGLIADMVLGVIGAIVGGAVFGKLGVAFGGLLGSLIVATIGAVILLVLVRLIKRA